MAFRITFVCTGNRCRSPSAERFLAALAPRGVTVDSCGTLDHDGYPSPRDAVRAGRARGIDLEDHRSRGMGSCDLGSSDLVVGFELAHVARAVVDGGARRETAFTLPELVRLLEEARDLPPAGEQRARAAVNAAHGARDANARFVPGEDIADPIGAPYEVHLRTAETIKSLTGRLAGHLFGRSTRPAGQVTVR